MTPRRVAWGEPQNRRVRVGTWLLTGDGFVPRIELLQLRDGCRGGLTRMTCSHLFKKAFAAAAPAWAATR
jgi:hypothetical protein